MLRYAILLSALACCAFGAIIPNVEISPKIDGRIVGGSAAAITSFPWQVSVQQYEYVGFNLKATHICGGAVYSGYFVLSAAHCLQGDIKATNLRIQAGSATLYDNSYIYYVSSIRNHEQYNPTTLANDIALIRTSSAIYLSGLTIRAIPLSTVNPSDGAAAVVTGWGATSYGAFGPVSTLQSVDVKIINRSVCEGNNYGYGKKIERSMICAAATGKDACDGDSGGPLVHAGNLVGIVSWGYGCASGYYPGVYADISHLRSWIISNVNTM